MTYVDHCRLPFRRMLMNHMMADSLDELHAMAERIGLRREWFQGDHYDVSETKRVEAIQAGAKEVSSRFLVSLRQMGRKNS